MIPAPHRTHRIPVQISGATKQIAVHAWGDDAAAHAVVCVHGLSRNGRDFDVLADALVRAQPDVRVLCPDVPGRGGSDWLDAVSHYQIPVYAAALSQTLTATGVKTYDWVGTSMGGLIGLVLACAPNSAMRKFVMNDVGCEIERIALERIGQYMRVKTPAFPSYESLFAAAQFAIAPFGPLTDAQKHHIVRTSCACDDAGAWTFNTDPKISAAFLETLAAPPVDLWPIWRAVNVPTLVLRGVHSDLLSAATLSRMLAENPHARAHEVANTGHAPMLMDAPTIDVIAHFLKHD